MNYFKKKVPEENKINPSEIVFHLIKEFARDKQQFIMKAALFISRIGFVRLLLVIQLSLEKTAKVAEL